MASGETNAYVIKLLSMLEAKRKVKEEGRVVPTWLSQLFPFSTLLVMDPIVIAKMLAAHPNVMSSILSRGYFFPFSSR